MDTPDETSALVAGRDTAAVVLDAIEVGVLSLDRRGLAFYANPAWRSLTGQAEPDWRGRAWRSLLTGAAQPELLSADDGVGVVHGLEVQVRDGSVPRILRLDVVRAGDPGSGTAAVVTASDVTEERAFGSALELAALHDSLTGLWNRTQFLDFLTQALAHAERDHGRRSAVFFVDVDDLKVTNDRAGHAAGDRLLRAVAACLTSAVRPGDVVARFGGDEFTVLCDDIGDGEAAQISRRILDAVEAASDATCSVSVGTAISTGRGDDAAEIIARADADMYRAKRASHHRSHAILRAARSPEEELAELLWALGAFSRLLRDRWAELDADDRSDALGAMARLHGRLERSLGATRSPPERVRPVR